MRRLLIVLAVLVACMAPNAAYAQEVDFLDSFTSGVGTWGGEQKEEMDSNSSVQEFENGGLLAAPAESEDGDSTVGQINSTLDAFNTVPWQGSRRSLIYSVRTLLHSQSSFLLAAVAMVFLWWGVRKGVRVLMAAWRRGHASV